VGPLREATRWPRGVHSCHGMTVTIDRFWGWCLLCRSSLNRKNIASEGGNHVGFYKSLLLYISTTEDQIASLGSNPRQPTNQSRHFPPTKYSASWALVFCLISQGPQPDTIPLTLAYPPVRAKVSVRVQQCAQTQEWITDRGMSTCASRKSPPSKLWLGLVDLETLTSIASWGTIPFAWLEHFLSFQRKKLRNVQARSIRCLKWSV